MLAIRYFRTGKKGQPFFKIVVTDKRKPPKSGRFVEEVGFFNPLTKEKNLKKERIEHWLSIGAQPSDTVYNLLIKERIIKGEKIDVHKKAKEKKTTDAAKEESKEQKPVEQEVNQGKAESSGEVEGEEKPEKEPEKTEEMSEKKKEQVEDEKKEVKEEKPEEGSKTEKGELEKQQKTPEVQNEQKVVEEEGNKESKKIDKE